MLFFHRKQKLNKHLLSYILKMGRTKQYKREEVFLKAVKTFIEHGYKHTTWRKLEKTMGINQNTILTEFRDKRKLFLEVLNFYMEVNAKALLNILLTSDGDLKDLRLYFEIFVNQVKSGIIPNGCLFLNTATEFGNTDAEIKKYLDSFYDHLNSAFIHLLTKAKEKGNIALNTEIPKVANFLVGCVQALNTLLKVRDEEKVQNFIDVTINSIQ